MQSTNESLQLNIVERDDEVYLGSLNLNIILKLTTVNISKKLFLDK